MGGVGLGRGEGVVGRGLWGGGVGGVWGRGIREGGGGCRD